MAYTDYPDNVMDEILGGAGGAKPNDAEEAVSFMEKVTWFITELFNEIFNFFKQLGELTK